MLALTFFGVAAPAAAQTVDVSRLPAKPIQLIVPFPPRDSNNTLGRFLAQRLSEYLGRQTIVDNRPGSDGIIGTELAARARRWSHAAGRVHQLHHESRIAQIETSGDACRITEQTWRTA